MISTKRSSSPSVPSAASSAGSQYRSTTASSGAPICSPTRSRSSSRSTAVRASSTIGQSTVPLEAGTSGSSAQVEKNTDFSRAPGMWRQISSAVNERIGASQRTIASAIQYIAVCAERRGWPWAGVVYRRSLITSR